MEGVPKDRVWRVHGASLRNREMMALAPRGWYSLPVYFMTFYFKIFD